MSSYPWVFSLLFISGILNIPLAYWIHSPTIFHRFAWMENHLHSPLGDTIYSKIPYTCFIQAPIACSDDKRQKTGTYCVSLSGEFLPPQLIYEGKTAQVHPKNVSFPNGFHVTNTPNHWSNEKVHLEYLTLPHYFCSANKFLLRAANVTNLFTFHDNLFNAFWPNFIAVSCIL